MMTDYDGVEPRRALQEVQPHQRWPRQRKAAPPIIAKKIVQRHVLLARREMRPVVDRQIERGLAVHDLQRSVESLPVEAGPQDAVPVDGALPGATQQRNIERSFDGVAELHDAGATVRCIE